MAKVIVGMSGGVDSAAAAYLLKKAGYEVTGVTLRTWKSSDGEENRCCEIDEARRIAETIGIEYRTLNCEEVFRRQVIHPFVQEYLAGRTPNPCIGCNPKIKWEWMEYLAGVLQADYVATGHYASVLELPNGRFTVKKAVHAEKDQTYMLYRLSQDQLKKTLMPLGKYSKKEVRQIAREAGLTVASKPDSQEICFVPDDDYAGFIRNYVETARNSGQAGSGEAAAPGKGDASYGNRNASGMLALPGAGAFVNEQGEKLGTHRGIIHYTVGQRRGLNLPLGSRAYVKEIRPETNEVVIGDNESLFRKDVFCTDICFMGIPEMTPGEKVRALAKIRYHHREQSAEVECTAEDEICIRFDEPVRAPAPGQSAVFYSEDGCVLGGGVIR